MSKQVLGVLALAIGPWMTGSANAAEYALDPAHTSIVFAASHLGYSYTYGRFNQVKGDFSFDAESPTDGQFKLTINAESVDTNDRQRDDHLRGPDFLDARRFPTLTFESTKIESGTDSLQLTGRFTMHGVTKEITIPLKVLGQGKGPYGKERVGFLSQFSLKRTDFGMTNMVGPVGDEISVLMSFEGIRQ